MTPEEYCQKKAASSGSSFYYSFLFLPQDQRQAITALYAFCREADDIVDDCQDTGVAEKKLQWWREEVSRLYQGNPQHPVSRALAKHLDHFNLPEEYLQEILDGMSMDITQHQYESFRDLSLYCHRVAGVVGLLSAEIFGYEDRSTLKYAENLGTAFQLTNIIRDVKEDILRGRIYLPMDEMQQFGVSIDDLHQPRTRENVKQLLKFQKERAEEYYQRAFEYLPECDRFTQRSGVIMSAIYRTLLEEIEADQFQVLEHRISLTPLRKFWLAWKTARHEKRFKKSA